jgi:hypothetical protein
MIMFCTISPRRSSALFYLPAALHQKYDEMELNFLHYFLLNLKQAIGYLDIARITYLTSFSLPLLDNPHFHGELSDKKMSHIARKLL